MRLKQMEILNVMNIEPILYYKDLKGSPRTILPQKEYGMRSRGSGKVIIELQNCFTTRYYHGDL